MTPTQTADQEEQERCEEEARREEAAEDELRLTAQEDVAVAREAEALIEAYPTADLDLPGHLQHETPEIGDGADGVEVDLPELASVPYTASRPSPLEAPAQAGLLDPGEDTSELVVAAVAGPPRRRAIPSPIRPPAVGQGAPAPEEESPLAGLMRRQLARVGVPSAVRRLPKERT